MGIGTVDFKYQVSPLDAIIAKAQAYGFQKNEYQTDIVVSGSSYTENTTISGCVEYPGINIVFISVDSMKNILQYKEIKEIENL